MITSILYNTWSLVLFGFVLEVGQMEEMCAHTFSYRFLISEVERYIVLLAKTMMKLMEMKFHKRS